MVIEGILMKKKRFTILELLVVLSIIIILASILLPALSNARKSVKRIACLNNLKQIGLYWGMYLSDYSENFPYYGSTIALPSYSSTLMNYLGQNTSQSKRPKEYLCPSDLIRLYNYSYGMNYTFGTADSGKPGRRLVQISRPSHLVLYMEADHGPAFSANYNGWKIHFPRTRHDRSYNILFIDGHCENMKERSFGLIAGESEDWGFRDDERWQDSKWEKNWN